MKNLGLEKELCQEKDLAVFKDKLGDHYYTAMQSFRVLQGREEKQELHTRKDLEQFTANAAAGQPFSET